MEKPIILSGMQPTGRLHVGNYEGALKNWIKLQDEGKYDCYYCIVDWHSLTVLYDNPEVVRKNTIEVLIDFLSAGLNPEKSVIFRQSDVKEHSELHLLFSMITPISWLERVPTYKEKKEQLNLGENVNYGLLGYPVLQAADIAVYKANYVPIGKDQLPHLELTREIIRRFNYLYDEVFPEPQPLLTNVPVLPGTDGRKMSKSYGNHIFLTEDREILKEKIMNMFTDPEKIRKTDKGHPDKCAVCFFHSLYNKDEHQKISEMCAEGNPEWGCVKCKKRLFEKWDEQFKTFREKREQLEKDPEYIKKILKEGAKKAQEKASMTMDEVRRKVVG